jgi:hypothetical protein
MWHNGWAYFTESIAYLSLASKVKVARKIAAFLGQSVPIWYGAKQKAGSFPTLLAAEQRTDMQRVHKSFVNGKGR